MDCQSTLFNLHNIDLGTSLTLDNTYFDLCRLIACSFITEDRHTANQVLEYFKAKRIGLASCDILAELRGQRPLSSLSLGPQAVPLASKVQSFDKFQPIVDKYFENWVVVPDSQQAVRILESAEAKRMKPFDIVTLSGELFKKVR